MASIRKRPNGLLEMRFNVDGKPYSVYGHNKKELGDQEQKKREQIKNGTLKGENVTVDRLFKTWIAEKALSVKSNSLYHYNCIYNKHIFPVFGNSKVQKIEKVKIVDFMTGKRKEVSARTYNQIRYILSALLTAAVNDDIIIKSPMTGIKSAPTENQATETIHKALTREQQALFLKTAKETNNAYYNLFLFLICTGCRIGEAGALKWSDIEYYTDGNATVHISRTLTADCNGKRIIGETPKTRKSKRDIPLKEVAIEALKRQKRQQTILGIDGDGLVFTTVNGALLTSNTVNDNIERITKKAGIERFTVHGLRDTFATRFTEEIANPQFCKELLGHSNINMTMGLYSQVQQEAKQTAMMKANIV